MENTQIYESLKQLNRQIEAMRLEKAKNELYDANRFNPFRFMHTDENGLSNILAFLLDSNEAHGQRDLFVRSFLQYLQLPKFLAYDRITVNTEKSTQSSQRRHDIFLEAYIGNKLVWVMSVENKLRGAHDQLRQMKDYWADLANYKTDNRYMIYLPAQEAMPSHESIEKDDWQALQAKDYAKILSARDLVKWLDQTPIVAPTMQNFIQQFKRFLNEEIMNLSGESNELIAEIINNQDMLTAAMTVIDNSWEIYEQLLQILDKQLQDKLNSEFSDLLAKGWQYERLDNFGNRYFHIFIDPPKGRHWGMGFEFYKSWFQDAYYGVWAHKKELSEKKYQYLQEQFSEFVSRNKSNNFWLGWTWVEDNLRNWNAEIWAQIPNGQLAERLFEKLRPLLKIAKTIAIE